MNLEMSLIAVKKRWAATLVGAVCLTTGFVADAHHSFSMFDRELVIERTVEIREFQWTNPHTWIQVYIPAPDGGPNVEWSIEGGGRNSLARSGWGPSTFRPGEIVELRFNPMRDGSEGGAFVGARFGDGRTIGTWNSNE